MSLNNLTKYHFSNEYGVTGTLAADPIFSETKKGKEYAKFAIYCKAQSEGENDSDRHRHKAEAHDIPLIAYIRVFNEALLDDVEQLKKGYFVNFTYNDITWNLGEDAETKELRVNPTFVALTLTVRHIPGEKKTKPSRQENGKENVRDHKVRSR